MIRFEFKPNNPDYCNPKQIAVALEFPQTDGNVSLLEMVGLFKKFLKKMSFTEEEIESIQVYESFEETSDRIELCEECDSYKIEGDSGCEKCNPAELLAEKHKAIYEDYNKKMILANNDAEEVDTDKFSKGE